MGIAFVARASMEGGKGGPSECGTGNRPPANREKETKPQDAPNSVWAILPIGKCVFRVCIDAKPTIARAVVARALMRSGAESPQRP